MPELLGSSVGPSAILTAFFVLSILGILRFKLDYNLLEMSGFMFGVTATGFIVWAVLDLFYDFMGQGPIWPFSS